MDAPVLSLLTGSPTQMSYVVVFTLLAASSFITVLEVIHAHQKPANPTTSNLVAALMIESGVNAVAGYFYYTMMHLAASNSASSLGAIRRLRSLDWSVTTPMMLLSLMYFYGHVDRECSINATNEDECTDISVAKKGEDATPSFAPVALALGLNAVMITVGSPWRPTGAAATWAAFATSCLAAAALVFVIYTSFYKDSEARYKSEISLFFLLVWGLYPAVRVAEILGLRGVEWSYNMLDLVSKGGFGVFVWAVLHGMQARCDQRCNV